MPRANFSRKNHISEFSMKKILLTTLFLSASVLMCSAQDSIAPAMQKINPAGRLILHDFKVKRDQSLKNAPGTLAPQGADAQQEPMITAVVLLEKGCESSVLDSLDLEVVSDVNGVVVVKCPLTLIERIAALPQVISVGFGDRMSPMLDYARPASEVQTVQSGFSYEGETRAFDGTGVICGMMDTGLEANHINFKNDDGSSRIKRLWHMKSNDGSSDMYTDQTISKFNTDNPQAGHATHVAGIIGGSYKGNGNFMKLNTASGGSGSMMTNKPIPYYGVATGSELAFAVGELYTPNIIQGVSNIIEYAKSTGKPVVVNLSLGSTTGPHDGTDYYSQSLSRLGESGIICMSAGNDGEDKISVTKTLGATGNNAYLRTMPVYMDPNTGTLVDGTINGIADLWSSNAEPLTVGIYLFTGSVGTATKIMEITGQNQVARSSDYTAFTNNFNGSVTLTSSVSSANNRFNVYMEFNGVTMKDSNKNAYIMIQASGQSGTKLNLYGSKVYFKKGVGTATVAALSLGDAKESINDACCGENILSVGAYTTRTTWGRLNGDVYQYNSTAGYSIGTISPFSSYGTTPQGKTLPLVCAPGANIISSYSSSYAGSNAANTMCASAKSGSKTYYWGAMQGTSMSCPYVTGTIGLWLQADPSLDFDRVMEVINNTSTPQTASSARWGAGKLNALEGIKYVLANSAVGQVWADEDQRLIITGSDTGYDVFVAGASGITATLYDLQGRPVSSASASGDSSVSVDASSLQRGIYILEARGEGFRFTRKVTL